MLCVSAFGLSEQAADPAHQGLDEGVAGSHLAVQALHLQQLPLQSLSETRRHVALQLQSHTERTSGIRNTLNTHTMFAGVVDAQRANRLPGPSPVG